MSGAIGHIGDEGFILRAVGAWTQLVEDATDRLDHFEIRALVVSAYIVCLARHALLVHQAERGDMVVDMQPVANVGALAIDRQRLAVQAIEDDQRNELFGEMVGTVVVGTVRDQRRQAVGVVPGADEMVGSSLRGGVGRMGRVGRLFGEESRFAQRTIHLIRGDVLESEGGAGVLVQRAPKPKRRLKERGRSADVRADEFAGAVDGAIDMRLGGQMKDRVGTELGERAIHGGLVTDVRLQEGVFGRIRDFLEGFQIAGVGKLVHDQYLLGIRIANEMANQGRSNETGRSCHDYALTLHLRSPDAWICAFLTWLRIRTRRHRLSSAPRPQRKA